STTGRAALWGGGVGVDAGGVCGACGAGGACGNGAVPWGLGGVMRVCAVCAPCPGPKPKSRAPATATAISATRMNNRLGPLDDVALGNRGSLPLFQRVTAISPFGTIYIPRGDGLCQASPDYGSAASCRRISSSCSSAAP